MARLVGSWKIPSGRERELNAHMIGWPHGKECSDITHTCSIDVVISHIQYVVILPIQYVYVARPKSGCMSCVGECIPIRVLQQIC